MYFKIGHAKIKAFILDTLDPKIGHGKPKICQIEHLRPSNWTCKTQNFTNWTL
jgi:hypothetical protein